MNEPLATPGAYMVPRINPLHNRAPIIGVAWRHDHRVPHYVERNRAVELIVNVGNRTLGGGRKIQVPFRRRGKQPRTLSGFLLSPFMKTNDLAYETREMRLLMFDTTISPPVPACLCASASSRLEISSSQSNEFHTQFCSRCPLFYQDQRCPWSCCSFDC